MHKQDLALNILKWLICNKTKPNQTKMNYTGINTGHISRELVCLLYEEYAADPGEIFKRNKIMFVWKTYQEASKILDGTVQIVY